MDTLESGEIDYVKFSDLLKKNAGRPAIVNVNVGTTVKGAVDDLDKILEALQGAGYGENRFFIHCDGALFGLMVSFRDLVTFCCCEFPAVHSLRDSKLLLKQEAVY